jgi:hypothetical protein
MIARMLCTCLAVLEEAGEAARLSFFEQPELTAGRSQVLGSQIVPGLIEG